MLTLSTIDMRNWKFIVQAASVELNDHYEWHAGSINNG